MVCTPVPMENVPGMEHNDYGEVVTLLVRHAESRVNG